MGQFDLKETDLLTSVVPLDLGVRGNHGAEEASLDLEGLEVRLGVGRRHCVAGKG